MRRVGLLALIAALAAPAATAVSFPGGTAVGVAEREWRISLYRTKVPTGLVKLNVRNYGEDGHDLAVRNAEGRVLGSVPELRPGQRDSLRVRLRRTGRFTVFCTLEGHEAKGMRAWLVVRKRSRRA